MMDAEDDAKGLDYSLYKDLKTKKTDIVEVA